MGKILYFISSYIDDIKVNFPGMNLKLFEGDVNIVQLS